MSIYEASTVGAYYEFLEREAPVGCEAIKTLWEWSENCSHPTPALIFLDLTGIGEDFFGAAMSGDMETVARSLGYLELSYLAKALEAYASRPREVERYARDLLEAEGDL